MFSNADRIQTGTVAYMCFMFLVTTTKGIALGMTAVVMDLLIYIWVWWISLLQCRAWLKKASFIAFIFSQIGTVAYMHVLHGLSDNANRDSVYMGLVDLIAFVSCMIEEGVLHCFNFQRRFSTLALKLLFNPKIIISEEGKIYGCSSHHNESYL